MLSTYKNTNRKLECGGIIVFTAEHKTNLQRSGENTDMRNPANDNQLWQIEKSKVILHKFD